MIYYIKFRVFGTLSLTDQDKEGMSNEAYQDFDNQRSQGIYEEGWLR